MQTIYIRAGYRQQALKRMAIKRLLRWASAWVLLVALLWVGDTLQNYLIQVPNLLLAAQFLTFFCMACVAVFSGLIVWWFVRMLMLWWRYLDSAPDDFLALCHQFRDILHVKDRPHYQKVYRKR